MQSVPFLTVYGWSAYLGAAAVVLTFVTGILFFTVGKPFGKINDISSVFQVAFMLPLAVLFVQFYPVHLRWLGWLAALLGIAGMVIVGIGQSLLVFNRIDFEGSMKFFPAGAAIGVWLVLSCIFVLGQAPPLLIWAGIVAGAGYVVTVIGFLWGGQEHWLFYLGALMLGIGYPVWGVWLGRLLLSGGLSLGL